MTGHPPERVTMLGALGRHLHRQGWRSRDTRTVPTLVAVFDWDAEGGIVAARVILHEGGAAELTEYEAGQVAALTRWEQVTPGNLTRIQTYIEGAER